MSATTADLGPILVKTLASNLATTITPFKCKSLINFVQAIFQ